MFTIPDIIDRRRYDFFTGNISPCYLIVNCTAQYAIHFLVHCNGHQQRRPIKIAIGSF